MSQIPALFPRLHSPTGDMPGTDVTTEGTGCARDQSRLYVLNTSDKAGSQECVLGGGEGSVVEGRWVINSRSLGSVQPCGNQHGEAEGSGAWRGTHTHANGSLSLKGAGGRREEPSAAWLPQKLLCAGCSSCIFPKVSAPFLVFFSCSYYK